MTIAAYIIITVIAAIAAVLIKAAMSDIKGRKIPNQVSLMIVWLFALLTYVELVTTPFSFENFTQLFILPTITGALLFAIGALLFALRVIGGGDVKLIAATGLIAGPAFVAPFLLYTAIAGGIIASLMLVTNMFAQKNIQLQTTADTLQTISMPAQKNMQVPYGVAIAASGLWVCCQRLIESAPFIAG